jgi:phosphatidyl-myo-inositol dimannoside synthase
MTLSDSAAKTKRILGLFPELLSIGGIQEAGRLTVAALDEIARRRGWVVELISLNDPKELQVLRANEQEFSFRSFGRDKTRFLLSAIMLARRSAQVGDIIALAAHPNLALPAAFMQRLSPGMKIVVISHGVEVWKPLSALRRTALLRADLVLAPSSDTARKLTDVQGVPTERIRILPWPLNPSFLRMTENPDRLSLPAAFPNGQVILTVGRCVATERYKGTDKLIRAIAQLGARLPRLHLVAVGGGDDLPRLRQIATELGISDRVHFLGDLSREELAACYAKADIFSLPSTGEGFGLVFLEAMAFARPIVGVACGGTTDLVENGINGLLVSPGDLEQLVQALEHLLHDETLCGELGRRGVETVRRKYQFDVFQARLEEILADSVARGNRS